MHDIARKKDTGEPGNGGQFGHAQRADSGVTLTSPPRSELSEATARMTSEEREMLNLLLAPENDAAGWLDSPTLEGRFQELEEFGGYEGLDFDREVRQIGDMLSTYRRSQNPGAEYGDIPSVDLVPDGEGIPQGYEVGVSAGSGFRLTSYADLRDATYDERATGARAAVALARGLSADMDAVMAKRERMRPPTMQEMRAAVQIADWSQAQQKVTFADTDDGQVQHAHIRTGRFGNTDGTQMADPKADERDSFVRFTMKSGAERFVPFRTVQSWVLESKIAAQDW